MKDIDEILGLVEVSRAVRSIKKALRHGGSALVTIGNITRLLNQSAADPPPGKLPWPLSNL